MEKKQPGYDYDSEDFDALAYLDMVWSKASFELNPPTTQFLDDMYEIFNTIDIPEGSRTLDFGCGPSIHLAIVASKRCPQVVLTEYAGQNRRLVNKWLKGEDCGFDWTHVFEYFGQKDGRSAAEIEQRTRAAITEVLACDAEKDNVFGVAQFQPFDVITTSLCLEAACKDNNSYKRALAQLGANLKPGGYLIQNGVFNQSKYEVKGKIFQTLPLTKEFTDIALAEAGFEPATWKIRGIETQLDVEFDAVAIFILCAKKK